LLRENQKKSPYILQSENNNYEWATFALINVLDVLSTLDGLEYSCITEDNPLFRNNKKPHRDHLLIHKLLIVPLIVYPQSHYWTKNDIQAVNVLVGSAVINNRRTIAEAKQFSNCPKIN